MGGMMKRWITIGLLLLTAAVATAAETQKVELKEQGDGTKTLSGMSIVGNDEAPKSLYIVPWKSSEIGIEASLDMQADKDAAPIDRKVFERQLNYYQINQKDNLITE